MRLSQTINMAEGPINRHKRAEWSERVREMEASLDLCAGALAALAHDMSGILEDAGRAPAGFSGLALRMMLQRDAVAAARAMVRDEGATPPTVARQEVLDATSPADEGGAAHSKSLEIEIEDLEILLAAERQRSRAIREILTLIRRDPVRRSELGLDQSKLLDN